MTEKHKANLKWQDSFCQKALKEATSLACHLVSEDGPLKKKTIKITPTFSLSGLSDQLIYERQEKFLNQWMHDTKFFNSFKKFSLPLCHKGAEKLIRDSLQLPSKTLLKDFHVKQAVISACLTILRQTIGSCFATAPAILIQEEYTDLFIQDLYDLLTQGRLKRVIRGVEYSAPLNLASCPKDHHPLLKAWEFTLASLSEAKRDVPRWNICLSLGLDPQDKGGLGETLYKTINEKLQKTNEKIDHLNQETQSALDQYNVFKSLLNQVSSESEMRRLHAECQARWHHFQSLKDIRDDHHRLSEHLSLLFSFLIKKYLEKIPDYFQEVYDPDMNELSHHEYEDAKAGFRLVYKHGRLDASLWTEVNSQEDFIKFLVDFFTMTENEVVHAFEQEEKKKIVIDVTSSLILHIRSDEFLKTALERTQKEGRLPWAYTSGGTMDSLVMTYFSRETPITQDSKWVESPLELLIFLIDTVKNLSHLITDSFDKNPHKRMLMHSTQHAFSIQPGKELFKQGWHNQTFTYTWVRDNFLIPMQNFYQKQLLSPQEQESLIERVKGSFRPQGLMQVAKFYDSLIKHNISYAAAFLYQALPLTHRDECQAALHEILKPWMTTCDIPKNLPLYVTSDELCALAKVNLASQNIPHLDIHLAVIERARKLHLAPTPFLFADTNWVESYFGFVVNPGTQNLELWRLDRTGIIGHPMKDWDSWLNGSEKLPWVVYTSFV